MSSTSEEVSWISWFCGIRGNEFFCEIDEDYIHDKFNLTGLVDKVPHYSEAMDVIMDMEPSDVDEKRSQNAVSNAAELLYGLIHQRFILTNNGIMKMLVKFQNAEFGRCPRFYCDNQPLLPVGLSDMPGEHMVKNYCPKCMDVYLPRSRRHLDIDGAFFGTGFPHLLFMQHPEQRPIKPTSSYVPRLYGFKIHPMAYQMQLQAAENAQARDVGRRTGIVPEEDEDSD